MSVTDLKTLDFGRV